MIFQQFVKFYQQQQDTLQLFDYQHDIPDRIQYTTEPYSVYD